MAPQVLNKQPPFWFLIKRAFPSATLQKQVFAFAPNIYSSVNLSLDLVVHENTHVMQQKNFIGACIWWIRYWRSPKFRVQMELEAYGAQLKFAKKMVKDRNRVADLLTKMAHNFSSPVYNNCIDYVEARKQIELCSLN